MSQFISYHSVHAQQSYSYYCYYYTGPPVPSWCDVMYTNSSIPPCTCIRTLYSYTTYKKTNREWRSPPFYSRDKGYKLELRVDANDGGSQLSLFLFLLKGEYDDHLIHCCPVTELVWRQ